MYETHRQEQGGQRPAQRGTGQETPRSVQGETMQRTLQQLKYEPKCTYGEACKFNHDKDSSGAPTPQQHAAWEAAGTAAGKVKRVNMVRNVEQRNDAEVQQIIAEAKAAEVAEAPLVGSVRANAKIVTKPEQMGKEGSQLEQHVRMHNARIENENGNGAGSGAREDQRRRDSHRMGPARQARRVTGSADCASGKQRPVATTASSGHGKMQNKMRARRGKRQREPTPPQDPAEKAATTRKITNNASARVTMTPESSDDETDEDQAQTS